MSSTPQPMAVRRGGAKRGDHGPYVAPIAEPAPAPDVSGTTDHIGSDTVPAAPPTDARRTIATAPDAAARAKAAYDAKPKVIFRGVDEGTAARLKAMYKDQLHKPGGVEGWSEWGRSLLEHLVDQYEEAHGPLPTDQDVQLRPGRVAGN